MLNALKDSPILAMVRISEHAVFVGIQVDSVKLGNVTSYTLCLRCEPKLGRVSKQAPFLVTRSKNHTEQG